MQAIDRALAQLGFTDAAARTILFDAVKAPPLNRRAAMAIAGQRAFYKLPAAARGPAATGLFAWAKAYVHSPAFAAAYAAFRAQATPADDRAGPSVDQAVKAQIDEMLSSVEEWRRVAATLPPADRDRMLENIRQQEAQARSPEFAAQLRRGLEVQQSEQRAGNASDVRAFDDRYPADPRLLVARQLREFLDATADVNFSARQIHLTLDGGPDGIELVDPADRQRPWMWQAAAIVGVEATTAARAAAQAWLAEVER